MENFPIKLYIKILTLIVCFLSVWRPAHEYRSAHGPEALDYPETGVLHGFERHGMDGYWKPNLGSLEEWCMLLTSEPVLWPPV